MAKGVASLCCYVLLLAFVVDAVHQQRIHNKPMAVAPADSKAMYSEYLFEGDIMTPYLKQGNNALKSSMGSFFGNALQNRQARWENGTVVKEVIGAAMKDYEAYTCITFKEKENQDTDYVEIISGEGCASSVGKIGGNQTLILGTGCVFKGIVMHELMHTLGFYHEQSRTDRDAYVTINLNNVKPGTENNFDSYGIDLIDALNTTYDYNSLMHYSSTAFSKNGEATIVPKQTGMKIGNRKGLSSTDAEKINKYYECPDTYPAPSEVVL
ncbi:unnamed protein product [Anisakis simplex]|uniref:Metalloendopeptidase n=1 Tax=Anisakis simplex TaxID=6269 RepID=A0A0M3JWE6_ANISI|nr:unnamed protein product [Anisakis simplex]